MKKKRKKEKMESRLTSQYYQSLTEDDKNTYKAKLTL